MNYGNHKTSSSIPVHRVAFVRPFTQYLKTIGTPVVHACQQAKLPFHALDNPDNYIPSDCFYKLLINRANKEGITDLGFRVADHFGADSADPHMLQLLQQSPTLYVGLRRACELMNKTITNLRVGVFKSRHRDFSSFNFIPSCGSNHPATAQISWFGLRIMIGMVRVFTGRHWRPTEIGIINGSLTTRYIREHFPNTRIKLIEDYSYITLENHLLSLKPHNASNTTLISTTSQLEPFTTNFSQSLEQILCSYIREDELNIELLAEICNMSKRSMQRKLTEMGTSYSELLDHARFRVASEMLKNADISITAIAHQLGYKDMSHFTRAFRRITGTTPSAYRHQHKLD